MFYSVDLLNKKGPYSALWLFGTNYCPGKTKVRTTCLHTDIVKSTKDIMNPQVPLALRLSAILMTGIVKIQAKKYEIIVGDYSSKISKLRIQPGVSSTAAVCLPIDDKAAKRNFEKITISEDIIASFDFGGFDIRAGEEFLTFAVGDTRKVNRSMHIANAYEITMPTPKIDSEFIDDEIGRDDNIFGDRIKGIDSINAFQRQDMEVNMDFDNQGINLDEDLMAFNDGGFDGFDAHDEPHRPNGLSFGYLDPDNEYKAPNFDADHRIQINIEPSTPESIKKNAGVPKDKRRKIQIDTQVFMNTAEYKEFIKLKPNMFRDPESLTKRQKLSVNQTASTTTMQWLYRTPIANYLFAIAAASINPSFRELESVDLEAYNLMAISVTKKGSGRKSKTQDVDDFIPENNYDGEGVRMENYEFGEFDGFENNDEFQNKGLGIDELATPEKVRDADGSLSFLGGNDFDIPVDVIIKSSKHESRLSMEMDAEFDVDQSQELGGRRKSRRVSEFQGFDSEVGGHPLLSDSLRTSIATSQMSLLTESGSNDLMTNNQIQQVTHLCMNKKTTKMMMFLKDHLESQRDGVTTFRRAVETSKRSVAVKGFFQVLILSQYQMLELQQDEAYSTIYIRGTDRLFENSFVSPSA